MAFDKNIPTKLKLKVYKTAIKPAMMYGENVGQLERRNRGNCTQLKCAFCAGQVDRRD